MFDDPHDRRAALLAWLRASGSGTTAEAATRLGVSRRTVLRDLAALRAKDVPIRSDRGQGGGIAVDATRTLPAVRLELGEVVGLALAVAVADWGLPFGPDARRGLDRVLAALPDARARELRRLLARVIVGDPASPTVRGSLVEVDPYTLARVEEAFTTRRTLAFAYTDRRGARSERVVEPHGLLVQSPTWYLLGWDPHRDAPRMFRSDRMVSPTIGGASFELRALEVFGALVIPETGGRPLSDALRRSHEGRPAGR